VNRPRRDSVSHAVQRRIAAAGPDHLWTLNDFRDLDGLAVAATLSRLSRKGDLQRIRRGVYYRPRPTVFGPSTPRRDDVVVALVRKRNGLSIPSGDTQYNRLGLTDQVSAAITIASDKPVRTAPVNGVRVSARVRPLRQQKGIQPLERAALDALRNVSRIPGADSNTVVSRVKQLIANRTLDIKRLVRYASSEPPRVRALLGAIGDDLDFGDDVRGLRDSLNPLSTFRVPKVRLVSAHSWNIRDASV
jgi:hypothetical protein